MSLIIKVMNPMKITRTALKQLVWSCLTYKHNFGLIWFCCFWEEYFDWPFFFNLHNLYRSAEQKCACKNSI